MLETFKLENQSQLNTILTLHQHLRTLAIPGLQPGIN